MLNRRHRRIRLTKGSFNLTQERAKESSLRRMEMCMRELSKETIQMVRIKFILLTAIIMRVRLLEEL
jgi:hypothetical protein